MLTLKDGGIENSLHTLFSFIQEQLGPEYNVTKSSVNDSTKYLNFIKEQLGPGFAVTIFIHIAKRALGKAVYDPIVEKIIQEKVAEEALELDLDIKSLQNFIDEYCQISKAIQYKWEKKGDNFEYSFSLHEQKYLDRFTEIIPALESVVTIQDLRDLLNGNLNLADQVLQAARTIISETRLTMFKQIKIAAENNALNNDDILKEITTLLDNVFGKIFLDLNLIRIIQNFVMSLSACKSNRIVVHYEICGERFTAMIDKQTDYAKFRSKQLRLESDYYNLNIICKNNNNVVNIDDTSTISDADFKLSDLGCTQIFVISYPNVSIILKKIDFYIEALDRYRISNLYFGFGQTLAKIQHLHEIIESNFPGLNSISLKFDSLLQHLHQNYLDRIALLLSEIESKKLQQTLPIDAVNLILNYYYHDESKIHRITSLISKGYFKTYVRAFVDFKADRISIPLIFIYDKAIASLDSRSKLMTNDINSFLVGLKSLTKTFNCIYDVERAFNGENKAIPIELLDQFIKLFNNPKTTIYQKYDLVRKTIGEMEVSFSLAAKDMYLKTTHFITSLMPHNYLTHEQQNICDQIINDQNTRTTVLQKMNQLYDYKPPFSFTLFGKYPTNKIIIVRQKHDSNCLALMFPTQELAEHFATMILLRTGESSFYDQTEKVGGYIVYLYNEDFQKLIDFCEITLEQLQQPQSNKGLQTQLYPN